MTDKEYIDSLVEKAKAAQEIFATYTQEQVDNCVRAIGKVVYFNAEMLAAEAVEETGMGAMPGKIAKLTKGPIATWRFLRDKKSVGVIEDNPVTGIKTIAKPMGIVADITPSTNPTSTACCNSMMAIKSRNAVIVSPHPQAAKSTAHGVELMRQALEEIGAPKDILQVIDNCTLELSQLCMEACDVVVATGGNFMVNAAYSCGRPSFGVGQGNEQTIIDKGYGNHDMFAKSIIANRSYDLGMPCTGDNSMFLPAEESEDILNAFRANGALVIDDKESVDKIREVIFGTGVLNRAIVGKTPFELGPMFGIDIPEDIRLIVLKGTEPGAGDILNKEILCPITRYFTFDSFEEAVDMACANLYNEGAGHSACLFSKDEAHIQLAGEKIPVGRLLIEQTGANAAGNTPENGLDPTLTIGCGTWGGNSISENLTYAHLMNKTRIAYKIEGVPYDPSEWDN